MRRIPYSPRVETWNAVGTGFPSTTVGIVLRTPARERPQHRAVPLDARLAVVGSTNPAKVEAVRRALARLAPGCALEAVGVPSGVRAQPVGDEETRLGAEARARAALALREADLGFGLEGGVVYDGPRTWL